MKATGVQVSLTHASTFCEGLPGRHLYLTTLTICFPHPQPLLARRKLVQQLLSPQELLALRAHLPQGKRLLSFSWQGYHLPRPVMGLAARSSEPPASQQGARRMGGEERSRVLHFRPGPGISGPPLSRARQRLKRLYVCDIKDRTHRVRACERRPGQNSGKTWGRGGGAERRACTRVRACIHVSVYVCGCVCICISVCTCVPGPLASNLMFGVSPAKTCAPRIKDDTPHTSLEPSPSVCLDPQTPGLKHTLQSQELFLDPWSLECHFHGNSPTHLPWHVCSGSWEPGPSHREPLRDAQ